MVFASVLGGVGDWSFVVDFRLEIQCGPCSRGDARQRGPAFLRSAVLGKRRRTTEARALWERGRLGRSGRDARAPIASGDRFAGAGQCAAANPVGIVFDGAGTAHQIALHFLAAFLFQEG